MLRSPLPRNTFVEAHGVDRVACVDEQGRSFDKPVAATEEEKRVATLAAMRRELEGCEHRIAELEEAQRVYDPGSGRLGRTVPVERWAIEQAKAARDNVRDQIASLEAEGKSEEPERKMRRRSR